MILKENGGDNEIKMKYYNCAATNLTLIAPYIGQATLPTNLSQKKTTLPTINQQYLMSRDVIDYQHLRCFHHEILLQGYT